MRKFKGWKNTYLGIGVLVMALLFCFGLNQKGDVQAAAQYLIRFETETTGSNSGEYELRRGTISAFFTDADGSTPGLAELEWVSSDPTVLEIVGESNKPVVQLHALKAGEVSLIAQINDPLTGKITAASRTVIVKHVIDESGSQFYKDNEGNSFLAIPLMKNGAKFEYTLSLIFPATVNWRTEDESVVKMAGDDSKSNNTGQIIAEGVGKTTITGKISGVDAEEIKLEVYVGPNIELLGNDNPIDESGVLTVDNKDDIYVGANLLGTNKTIHSSIEWIVRDIVSDEIVGSSEKQDVIITESVYNPYLTVDARAGEYMVEIYTAGILSKNLEYIPTDLLKTFRLKVKANCSDQSGIYIQKNDTYDIAEVFNMTPEDFEYCFNVQGDVGQDENATYSLGIITGQKEGTANIQVALKNDEAAKKRLETLLGIPVAYGKVYNIEVNIYNGFRLEVSKVTIAVGGEFQLKVADAFINMGNVVWSCEDPSVEVSQNGLVKGKKVTKKAIVKATMKLDDGRTLSAECEVEVTTTADKIIFKETEFTMKVGDTRQVTVDFTSSIAGIDWVMADGDIAEFEKISNKSVEVTALKEGTTILTVVNKDNFVSAYCKIIVVDPVKEIKIIPDVDPLVVKLTQQDLKLKAECKNIDGKLLKEVELKWTSENESVAKIDPDTGFVELKGAGKTVIEVKPKGWNPYIASYSITLKVLASATDITLNEDSYTLEVGEKKQLEVTPNPTEATVSITWESIDGKIATVDDKGLVTAKAPGQTYIIAYTENGLLKKCLITVKQKASGVTLDKYELRLAVGESYTVKATPKPETSTDTTFTWKSSDPKIATVNNEGKITGVSASSTPVVVTVTPPTGTSELIFVTVYDKAKGMTLSHSEVTIVKGETFKLKPVFTPSNVTNKNVKWTSLNEKVATISKDGKIKALKGGTTVITAVSEDGGYFDTCVVTVTERITSVKLNKSEVVVGVGKTYKLKATVKSNSASNPKVKWITSNKKIVKVSKNGNIRGVKVGTATITVKVTDGTNKKATCKVRVVRPVTKVSLNKKVLNIVVGQTGTLKATIKPSNATIKTVKWSSGDSTIAEVDQDGTIFGLSLGQTKVTATAKDNTGKKASCYVNVIEEIPASSIVLSAKNLTLMKGDSEKIGYSIVPHNNTDKVYFDSDNRAVATVNGSGKVYGKRAGVANITISTTSGKQATVKVTVLGLNKTKLTMEQYDTETLFIDGTTTGITWFTSNPSVATVQQGKVVARKAGKCAIYAKVNGISLKCNVVVKKINK